MTLLDDLEAAASELFNCEATSDANADEQLEMARRLRAHAERLWSEMERHGHNVGVAALLERINNGPITPGEPKP
jgi:hypothetical protein